MDVSGSWMPTSWNWETWPSRASGPSPFVGEACPEGLGEAR